MIAALVSTLVFASAAPAEVLRPEDPIARRLSQACVSAVMQDLQGPPAVSSTTHEMIVRRKAARWAIDYDVTVQDRVGRSQRWVGQCVTTAPRAPIMAAS